MICADNNLLLSTKQKRHTYVSNYATKIQFDLILPQFPHTKTNHTIVLSTPCKGTTQVLTNRRLQLQATDRPTSHSAVQSNNHAQIELFHYRCMCTIFIMPIMWQ